MALASLGIHEIQVFPALRIAILSTGEEIVSHHAAPKDHLVRDANGPFLETALQSLRASVRFWGIVGDDGDQFAEVLSARLGREREREWTSSSAQAVSMGRFDFVEAGVARLGGETGFHRVSVRPGHPILFGVVPQRGDRGDIEV
jgi:molybdopterin molybdotransferase